MILKYVISKINKTIISAMFGSWFDHVKGWEQIAQQYPKNVLQIHYERLNKVKYCFKSFSRTSFGDK